MKRLLLGLCCALLLSGVGPLPALSTQEPQTVNAEQKTKSKWHWFHREKKHHENSNSAQSTHKSRGWWWHHGGRDSVPAGVGADQNNHASARRERSQHSKSAPLYSSPKSEGRWHNNGPGPAGAGAK
ncbi:MAG: hypothetical protein WBL63_13925 [Candidatus Acidiferrum sp.]